LHGFFEQDIRTESIVLLPLASIVQPGIETGVSPIILNLPNGTSANQKLFIEALVYRAERIILAKVPFAKDGSGVSPAFEKLGQCLFIWLNPATNHFVPSSHQGTSCWLTQWTHQELRETRAVAVKAVNFRGLDNRIPVTRHVAISLIIREKDNYIRLLCRKNADKGNCKNKERE
jgi:hypothetical protein